MKRSTDLDELYYPENKDEYLEVASNVVFERLRRSTDDNGVLHHTKKPNPLKKVILYKTSHIRKNGVKSFDGSIARDLKSDRVRRQAPVTDETNTEGLTHKLEIDDSVDAYAKTIDMEALQKQNRPADILEYKQFLKVHTHLFTLRVYNIFRLYVK